MTDQDILNAIREAYSRVGTQGALAKQAGVTQSTISDYLSGRYSVGNMTISTFLRLFPDMQINFFGARPATRGADLMRNQLLEIFESLSDIDKLRCITIVAANFGDKIKKETQDGS